MRRSEEFAFVLSESDLEKNRRRSDIWLLDVDAQGAEPRRLTDHTDNDENHWVLAPGNSIQWHETVAAWLERYLKQ